MDCGYNENISKKEYLKGKIEKQRQNIETKHNNLKHLEELLEEQYKEKDEQNGC